MLENWRYTQQGGNEARWRDSAFWCILKPFTTYTAPCFSPEGAMEMERPQTCGLVGLTSVNVKGKKQGQTEG